MKARTAPTTAYTADLRASETVCLKVTDLDSQRMVIQIRRGKGPRLVVILRTCSRLARP
nr:hypothetical protein [Sinorhizobium meliloti]